MKKTKKNLFYAIFVSVISLVIFIMYFLDGDKTWEINVALYAALIILPLSWIIVLISRCLEKKELHEHYINEYHFKPIELDLYQDLRVLMEQKEMTNSTEEKELLEKYKMLAYDLTKTKSHYLVYINNIPHALIKYQRDFKNKCVHIETLFSKEHDFEKELDLLIKKEGFQRK